jgi:hypothetical protein
MIKDLNYKNLNNAKFLASEKGFSFYFISVLRNELYHRNSVETKIKNTIVNENYVSHSNRGLHGLSKRKTVLMNKPTKIETLNLVRKQHFNKTLSNLNLFQNLSPRSDRPLHTR